MLNLDNLYRGLSALARAGRVGAMAGHLGAAVVAGHFLCSDRPRMRESVGDAIGSQLDRIMRGDETVWYDCAKAGVTIPELFEPIIDQEGHQPGQVDTLIEALSGNIEAMRQSGHNVIFASLAIRALHEYPQFAVPSIVGGIRRLIHLFDNAGPGRGYYGEQRGWAPGEGGHSLQHGASSLYESERELAEVVIDRLIEEASVRRQGFGGLFHVINHAAALIDLTRFGHRDVAQSGFAAHRHHMRLWASLPDVEQELGALQQAAHDPRTPEYWRGEASVQWSGHLTHRIKTLYGFFTLLDHIDQPDRVTQAEEQFLYLMA